MILLLACAILTPLYVSFVDDDDETFDDINLIFNIGFGLDILLNFITAYYNSKGELVTSFSKIALKYLKCWFWIDLIAMYSNSFNIIKIFRIPFDEINLVIVESNTGRVNKLFKLLRFPRLYRMLRIFQLVKIITVFSKGQKMSKLVKNLNLNINILKIFKVFVHIFFLNHVVGCIWFFLVY